MDIRNWGSWPKSKNLTYGWGVAVLIETVTIFSRFGLGLQTTRDTTWIAAFTFGYRIHHGYIGLVLLLISLLLKDGKWRNLFIVIGIGLVLSDLFHHFLVLWPFTGDPEFHGRYPDGS